MKIQFGDFLQRSNSVELPDNLHRINSPSWGKSLILSALIGLLVPVFLVLWLTFLSIVGFGNSGSQSDTQLWISVGFALLLFVPLHELAHAIMFPGAGFTNQTRLVIWPSKLRVGVYFDGCLSRRRWLLMRAAPLFLLSILPLLLLTYFRVLIVPGTLVIFLQILMLANGVGSGADIAAFSIVLKQVPSKAMICFHGGRAYWQLNDSTP